MKTTYKTLVDLIPDARHFAIAALLGDEDAWRDDVRLLGVEGAVDAYIAAQERETATAGGLWPCTDEWVPDFRASARSALIDSLS